MNNLRKLSMILACLGTAFAMGACDDDSETVSGCPHGAAKCNGNDLDVCYGVNWQTVPCPNGCDSEKNICIVSAGAECSITTCKSETVAANCVDGKIQETACNENGHT